MDSRSELERVEVNNDLTSVPANPWYFDVMLGDGGQEKLDQLLDVLALIVKKASESQWPLDDYWRAALPEWLKRNLPELTKDQVDHLLATTPRAQWDQLPWDLGSWLDAIKDRGWRWWGYKTGKAGVATLVLHVAMFPERIDAFRHLLSACGIQTIEEHYAALSE